MNRFFLFIVALMWIMTSAVQAGPCCAHFKNKKWESARAYIVSTQGDAAVKGTVHLHETENGLHVFAEVEGLSPGKHGFHIHEFGDISNKGLAAGGHYNPHEAPHGYAVTHNFHHAHPGDLGNIEVNAEGKGTLELTVPNLRLTRSKYSVAGRAIIIHEKEDDFSQPTGNAGSRIAGGAIILTDD